MRPLCVRPVLVALVIAVLSGCGGGDVPLAEVTGLVTFNGQPAHAEVIFEPQGTLGKLGGRPSSAYTKSDGTYRLAFTANRFGAVIATHKVLIRILRSPQEGEAKSLRDVLTPRKQVRLVRTVASGSNRFNYAVQW